MSDNHSGNVPAQGIAAKFTNIWMEQAAEPGETQITVEKIVAGEIPDRDIGRIFYFTVTVCYRDGATPRTEYVELRDGETSVISLPVGAVYRVEEVDCFSNGYLRSVTDGYGTATAAPIRAVQTNTFAATVTRTVEGEKTWDRSADPAAPLPESIEVRLLGDGALVETAVVRPDGSGRWLYAFEVPEFDADGSAVTYTVEEAPVENWRAAVDGYNITNTYRSPAVFTIPPVQKVIAGDKPQAPQTFRFRMTPENNAPMPGGALGGVTAQVLGEGTAEFGVIRYCEPGSYVYRVDEIRGDAGGYTYDDAVYTLTVEVAESNHALTIASSAWAKAGSRCEAAVFTNRYSQSGCPPIALPPFALPPVLVFPPVVLPPVLVFPPVALPPVSDPPPSLPGQPEEKVIVCGQKTWEHGDNDPADYPTEMVVRVLRDGEQAVEKSVTARDGWRWFFALEKYDEQGREIAYTVDEREIPGYVKQVRGYNITNTWQSPSTVEATPKTGETRFEWLLIPPMLLSAAGLALLRRRRDNAL
jgi:pilin isopeptide linkage protein